MKIGTADSKDPDADDDEAVPDAAQVEVDQAPCHLAIHQEFIDGLGRRTPTLMPRWAQDQLVTLNLA